LGASYGQIWMKIGGNQAGAFPDLPVQPGNLDVNRKTVKKAKDFIFVAEHVYPIICLIPLAL